MDNLNGKLTHAEALSLLYLRHLFSVILDLSKISKNELDPTFSEDVLAVFKL